MTDDIVARFEPARAVLRPVACDEREGCWVKIGPAGYKKKGKANNGKCTACRGTIFVAGLENLHAAALARCYRAQGTSS